MGLTQLSGEETQSYIRTGTNPWPVMVDLLVWIFLVLGTVSESLCYYQFFKWRIKSLWLIYDFSVLM